jgi:amino acid permease
MTRLRILQAFEVFLVLSFLFGIVAEFRNPQWPSLIGFAVNVLWQYMTLSAIRKQKKIMQLTPSEQTAVMNQQQVILKPLLISSFLIFVVLAINVGLVVSNTYSTRTFGFVVLTATVVAVCYLVFSFTRLQKRQR